MYCDDSWCNSYVLSLMTTQAGDPSAGEIALSERYTVVDVPEVPDVTCNRLIPFRSVR